MTTDMGAPVLALTATALVQMGGLLIWGANLTARVKAIEEEIEPLKAMLQQVARMDARLEGLLEQFKDLNASIRWMRDPAADEGLARVAPRRRMRP